MASQIYSCWTRQCQVVAARGLGLQGPAATLPTGFDYLTFEEYMPEGRSRRVKVPPSVLRICDFTYSIKKISFLG